MSRLKMTLLALTAPVGACAPQRHFAEPAWPTGYNFAYTIPQGENVGLVQAFDDGQHTYLQFRDDIEMREVRVQDAGVAVPAAPETRYLRVDGTYSELSISTQNHAAIILNRSAFQAAPPSTATVVQDHVAEPAASYALASVGVPESLQTMHPSLRVHALNTEIALLADRIETLTQQIEEARRQGSDMPLSLRSDLGTSRFMLRFADNSDAATLDDDALAALGAAARAANRIYLHGHTDSYTASDTATDLAIRRVVSVRKLLIAQDVAANRIRLFYRGAGSFVANNRSPEGKAINRRVEIELRGW